MPVERRCHVAIVGAGVSGVVTAAHLKKEGLDVTVFERSQASGGIWLFDERKPLEPKYPSVNASDAERHYESIGSTNNTRYDPEIVRLLHAPPGPCYFGLKNNVSTRLLQTTLNRFPPDTPDFVGHEVLLDYIQGTAVKTKVHSLTKYNTEVKSLRKIGRKWLLEAVILGVEPSGTMQREQTFEEFDSVVIASGHYHAPRIPDIPGLASWKRQWPNRVTHSKGYRRPEEFKGKNFLLIGGSVSSTDIARELGPLAENIYQSHRNGAFDLPASLLPENAIRIDEVALFEDAVWNGSCVPLEDMDPIPNAITLKSGRKLCEIHHVILCTGYHVTLPFLHQLHSDSITPERVDDTLLVTDGAQLHNLHKDIFYIRDTSLAFVGVPYFTATFTLFEFQAMVVAKVFSGQVKLPNEEEMRTEYQRRVQAKGYGKAFHSLKEKEVEYVDELLEWVNRDLERLGRGRLEGHTEKWHEAKEQQVVRMRAMFAADTRPEKKIEVTCR